MRASANQLLVSCQNTALKQANQSALIEITVKLTVMVYLYSLYSLNHLIALRESTDHASNLSVPLYSFGHDFLLTCNAILLLWFNRLPSP